jgi:ASPIC and UnbV/Integrase core domain
LDTVFVERLWRGVKYEDICINCYDAVPEFRQGPGRSFGFYNDERPHQSLEDRTPVVVGFASPGRLRTPDRPPGQGNHWLTVKLVGKKTNRAAIGARITIVTDGESPSTVRRHVTSGSSFGANPLRQQLGLARATRVATLEVYWPTSGTTQVFHDLAADQIIEITEFENDYRKRDSSPMPKPY